jgi:NAD(P)H-dependent FMN reductase
MSEPPVRHVLGVVGSLRHDSYDRRRLAHAAAIAPDPLKLDVATDLIRLPLFDEDLETDGRVGKPVALIGASIGRVGGTVQAQGQVRVTLAVIGAHVLPSPPIRSDPGHCRRPLPRLHRRARPP